MKNWLFQRVCAFVLSLSILSLGSPAVSYAGLIDTVAVVDVDQRQADLATVRAGLERADVRERFVALGVDPLVVDSRVAALTDSELHDLAGRMEQMPAGGDVLAVIGVVFLILLILELVGVIDIFKKTP
jgi:hypothetical protein